MIDRLIDFSGMSTRLELFYAAMLGNAFIAHLFLYFLCSCFLVYILLTPPHMAVQKQDDQHEHTFSSYVRIRDVVLKTYRGRWTIGRSGERGSGISVLPARYDDDDDFIQIICVCLLWHETVSFSEAPVLELWSMMSVPSLLLLLGTFWQGAVVPVLYSHIIHMHAETYSTQ